jgi:trans-feruloyl-CoA hydratase/vanillin synthase
MEKNPHTLRAAKEVYKFCRTMDYAAAEDYMSAKGAALRAMDPEKGREEGTKQFLDDKTFRPGLGAYKRSKKG